MPVLLAKLLFSFLFLAMFLRFTARLQIFSSLYTYCNPLFSTPTGIDLTETSMLSELLYLGERILVLDGFTLKF
jgi:hypothetical protein